MAEPIDSREDRPSPRSFAASASRVDSRDAADPGPPFEQVSRPAGRTDRQAAEWGLASLLMAGFLLLFVPGAWIFALAFWISGNQVVATANTTAVTVMLVGIVASYVALIGLSVASVVFGIRALQISSRRGQPAGLPLAGAIMSIAALVFITLTGAGLLAVVLSFVK